MSSASEITRQYNRASQRPEHRGLTPEKSSKRGWIIYQDARGETCGLAAGNTAPHVSTCLWQNCTLVQCWKELQITEVLKCPTAEGRKVSVAFSAIFAGAVYSIPCWSASIQRRVQGSSRDTTGPARDGSGKTPRPGMHLCCSQESD